MAQKSQSPDSGQGQEIKLDPRNLKGLAHPLRVRILGSLREEGPATASMLAGRLGESSGATSYHLRQLSAFGFIEEDPNRGSQRERWWRAAQRSTWFDEKSVGTDAESRLLGAEYLRAIANGAASRTLEWIDSLPSAPGDWASVGTMSDYGLRMKPEEVRELAADIEKLIARYHVFDPETEAEPGEVYVAVQFQLLPKLPGGRS